MRQTIKQTLKQTIKQAMKQTIIQMIKQTVQQTIKQIRATASDKHNIFSFPGNKSEGILRSEYQQIKREKGLENISKNVI